VAARSSRIYVVALYKGRAWKHETLQGNINSLNVLLQWNKQRWKKSRVKVTSQIFQRVTMTLASACCNIRCIPWFSCLFFSLVIFTWQFFLQTWQVDNLRQCLTSHLWSAFSVLLTWNIFLWKNSNYRINCFRGTRPNNCFMLPLLNCSLTVNFRFETTSRMFLK